MSQNFEKVTKAFEVSVKTCYTGLQYLVDHDKVRERFIHKQNRILSNIIAYQVFIEKYTFVLVKQDLVFAGLWDL